ncbi:dTDP-4-dehydrorhamnose reductase [Sediminibacterium sp.]|uniref:dTDP-4-dehydrorhamnose reductase n=1 Tax=Sediminibacterium sp. TaxID=1917865 RepID=UPI0027359AB8|nr:dTDP-4-dehydrorhamnose reductase [Sediminibacterium sp.]MDP3392591.1 dTDP-4-dehydrorhamnose reductase [Sediminibacterium sp.]MDP3566166.1 dTDP-4-dehydrorhamnose reductase [Sediminibacterium sp.]
MKPIIVVTGKNGQLGWELQQLASAFENRYQFIFTDRTQLNLSNPSTIHPFFTETKPQYFINCAAYTAVDKAETDQEAAMTINATVVGEIAACCEEFNCKLITISTDYVFNGNGTAPYKVDTPTDPVNYYGATKAIGEQLALTNNASAIIIRTSWVYSAHGNNFVKTMLRLMKERPEIKVVNDQEGCPTYAADLAAAIMQIIESLAKGNHASGIYHYSNTGAITWFDFARAISEEAGLTCSVLPIPSLAFPTPAKRPAYSVMDVQDIATDFGVVLKPWRESLKVCIEKI